MPTPSHASTWSSTGSEEGPASGPLADRLADLACDRVAGAQAVVRETARLLLDWVYDQPVGWTTEEAGEALHEGLDDWLCDHGWRGAAACFGDTLEALLDEAQTEDICCRAALGEELGLWLSDGEAIGGKPWSGRPLERGARLISPGEVASQALGEPSRGLSHGETIVVVGASEVVLDALVAAAAAGLAPRPLVGEGGPLRSGVLLARRLVEAGLEPTLTFDARIAAEVHAADRVWVASEAVGEAEFTAPAGCASLLARAREAEVQVELLVTSDAFTPSGEAETPAWNAAYDWVLWEDAPAAAHVRAEAFEQAPLTLCHHLVLESGRHSARAFARGAETRRAPHRTPNNEPNHVTTGSRAAAAPANRAADRPRSTQR